MSPLVYTVCVCTRLYFANLMLLTLILSVDTSVINSQGYYLAAYWLICSSYKTLITHNALYCNRLRGFENKILR
jgi:hypothetical protein